MKLYSISTDREIRHLNSTTLFRELTKRYVPAKSTRNQLDS